MAYEGGPTWGFDVLTMMLTAVALTASKPGQPSPPKDASVSPVCTKLMQDFDGIEMVFSMIHDLKQILLKIAENYQRAMEPSEKQAAMAEARLRAVGGTPRARYSASPSSAEKVEKARRTLDEGDAEFMEKGDRITMLLIATKCPPPDHVTTWFTYSDSNPEGAANKERYKARANAAPKAP